MTGIFITRKDTNVGVGEFDSIAWAFEVHVKQTDTRYFNSAILRGNEDSPEEIHFFRSANPLNEAKSTVWTPENGLVTLTR